MSQEKFEQLKKEDMLNPQVDINQPPLRREDMMYTTFEEEKTIHKRR